MASETTKTMRKRSLKQAARDRKVAEIKKSIPKVCSICGNPGNDLAHLLPKSIYPEHYTNPDNLVILCRDCHRKFDNDLSFRQKQGKLFEKIRSFDEQGAFRYFRIYD